METFVLRGAAEIHFGCGVSQRVGKIAATLGHRALIVTGRSAGSRQRAERIAVQLQAADVPAVIFAGVEPEPSLATVEAGRQALREAQADLVIAIGGGSALDVGKAIGALAPHVESVDFYFSNGKEIPGPGLPVIALPTTAGTGAEVTPNSVLSDPAARQKASIRGLALLPRVALVDPELTRELPPQQTAFSGLDALVQAIEAYTSTGANLISDMYAEEAVQRLGGAIRRAVTNGTDMAARTEMALGSLLAGLALASARLGLVHGLAHPLGALYHLPHGGVCGWLMPYVMRYNLPAAAPRYARLAQRLGLGADAESLIQWMADLACELGASGSWRAVGLRREDFPTIIPLVVAAGSSQFNPQPVTPEGVQALLEELYES